MGVVVITPDESVPDVTVLRFSSRYVYFISQKIVCKTVFFTVNSVYEMSLNPDRDE